MEGRLSLKGRLAEAPDGNSVSHTNENTVIIFFCKSLQDMTALQKGRVFQYKKVLIWIKKGIKSGVQRLKKLMDFRTGNNIPGI